jgi:dihydropyrimidinase
MYDLLVKGGKVVSPEATIQANVAVKGDKVVGLISESVEAKRTIDAAGKYVLPGLIDPHTHFGMFFMGNAAYDYFHGTRAAAFGGVTTIINFIMRPQLSPLDAIEEERSISADAAVDYSFHLSITKADQETIGKIKECVDAGIPSFKLFMMYRKEGLMTDDGALMAVLQEAKKHNALTLLHAENNPIFEYNADKYLSEGKKTAGWFAKAKYNFVEAEAIQRAITLAQEVGAELYIVHMSTKEGYGFVKQAHFQGLPIYAETCTHYLQLTDEVHWEDDGFKYVISPPIRFKEDTEAMWKGLANGTIVTTGSDDCGFNFDQKAMGKDSFDLIPNGCAGVEVRLPIMFSEGVNKGRISVNRLVEVTSTNSARLFGLYPQKGIIAPGSDADLVIVDPHKKETIRAKDLHMADYSIYEGLEVTGYPITTILRGKVIVENGEFKGKAADGKFLKRVRE